ncbi:MAG TPA: nucleotidyltransferase [Spirochaetota bacterium]|nr:nucleotidyltransferase [Spirochaetota bacterium]HPR50124.1 nucleotidyltransferase [Spirochaetota bacterium]
MRETYFSDDIREFLFLLGKYKVKYVIVGGEAVIYYGHARLTGDIDFFYESTFQNAQNLYGALLDFWDQSIPGINSSDVFLKQGTIVQFGQPPNRLDLINVIDGVSFQEAWETRVSETINVKNDKCTIYFINLENLIRNKKAAKRHKDLEDIKFLKRAIK